MSLAAFGQVDFSGQWESLYREDAPERLPGPELGDYLGMPLNEAGRLRADSYDADRISVVTEYPAYLNTNWVTSTGFRKQADAANWNPTACTAR